MPERNDVETGVTEADLRTYAYWSDAGRKFKADWLDAHQVGTPVDEPIQYIGHLAFATHRLLVEVARLKEERDFEQQAARRLCQIYFEIAEQFLPADAIREQRDAKIAARAALGGGT